MCSVSKRLVSISHVGTTKVLGRGEHHRPADQHVFTKHPGDEDKTVRRCKYTRVCQGGRGGVAP